MGFLNRSFEYIDFSSSLSTIELLLRLSVVFIYDCMGYNDRSLFWLTDGEGAYKESLRERFASISN